MRSIFKSQVKKGFTLIEVLVTSIILGFVLTGTAMVMQLNTRLSNEGIAEAFLQSNLQNVTQRLSSDVRKGCTLSLSNNNNTFTIKDNAGSSVIWVYNPRNKKITRNNTEILAIGVDKAEYICNFNLDVTGQTATIELKLDVTKGVSFKASTGDVLILYRYSCRNVEKT